MAWRSVKQSRKKHCGQGDKARQAGWCPHILWLITPFWFDPFFSITSYIPSSLLPFPFPTPSTLLDRAGFNPFLLFGGSAQHSGMPGRPGTGALAGAQASGACGQLAEPLQVKHLGLRNQRHCRDLTFANFAEYYVTESWGERRRMKWKDIMRCEILRPAAVICLKMEKCFFFHSIVRSRQGK